MLDPDCLICSRVGFHLYKDTWETYLRQAPCKSLVGSDVRFCSVEFDVYKTKLHNIPKSRVKLCSLVQWQRRVQASGAVCPNGLTWQKNASLPCAPVSDAWQCITCDARTNMAEKWISPVHAAARIIFAMPCITYSPIRSATGNVV